MPAMNLLIKPASGLCNMSCSYCFYRDETLLRETAFAGMLSREKTEILIKEAVAAAQGSCTFVFQGGEPTLAGLDYYRFVVDTQQKYARGNLKINNAIQTNGLLLNAGWVRFFKDNRFLVGLSLDGFAELHNAGRNDRSGRGTFSAVMNAARLLEKYAVDFNILGVVTDKSARSTEKLMNFYLKNGFRYLQFIPCIAPLEAPCGELSLSPEGYLSFLIKSFDIWYARLMQGEYFSIRHIDNYISILSGRPPESCGMCGKCSIQYVTEGDGGIYPCDFYVLDEKRLGTVGETPLIKAGESEIARKFIEESLSVPEKCGNCRYYPLCRNGCRRERDLVTGINRFCSSYSGFFSAREKELCRAAAILGRR